MKFFSASLAIVALSSGLSACAAAGQRNAGGTATLQAQDYIDIRQLIESYSAILDNCTNNGNTYADLFTPDATFGVSSEWGRGAKIWFRGREQLRTAGGGGKDTCRPPQRYPEYPHRHQPGDHACARRRQGDVDVTHDQEPDHHAG